MPDSDVHVTTTTGISMSTIDVVNLAILASITNLATKAGNDGINISVDLNNWPLPPREDPPQFPPTEGRILRRHHLRTTIWFRPWYYVGKTRVGIGESTVGEPHVDLGEDLELARVREAVFQVGVNEEPGAANCDILA
uniref:Uncharacterized protein n=1 Tax=Cannabis sativa TaxID=3483 RepID=A0A803P4J6_CANSA